MEADAVRRRLHPEGVVSYAIDGRVAYTQAAAGAGFDQLCEKISNIVMMGGHGVMLQGEVTPALTISWFDGLFRSIKQRFPAIWLHSLSASEILSIAEQTGATAEDTVARLHDAGLDSIPGDDAGILDDAVQQGTGTKRPSADWLAVHRAAHKLGMQTTASMTFGVRRDDGAPHQSPGSSASSARRDARFCLVHAMGLRAKGRVNAGV